MGRDTDLDRLVERFGLGPGARERLDRLVTVVLDHSAAPTSIRSRSAVVADHIADSLVAVELPALRSARTMTDIGSGAGFPGLVLAIANSEAQVSLVESNGRKCHFLTEAVEEARIGNATVVNARVEEWSAGIGANDVVTARAVAGLDVVAEYAAPLLRVGGVLIAWRGRRDGEEEAAAARAAAVLGLEPEPPRHVSPYREAEHRHLHVFRKIGETPARFPRRPGIPRKYPLGNASPPRANGAPRRT